MTTKNRSVHNALVAVLDDLQTANDVIESLHKNGFALEKIELVTRDVYAEAPEVETPKVHETTGSSIIHGAGKWGRFGAAVGAIAGSVMAPFPGVGLGMVLFAGLAGGITGALVGGVAGTDDASTDDTVDLPTLDEYEALVEAGNKLVVVLGNHEEVIRAKAIVNARIQARMHIHPVHGHAFHEHPAHSVEHPQA